MKEKITIKNKKIQKFISILLMVLILMPAFLFFIPKKTAAQQESASACAAAIAAGQAAGTAGQAAGTAAGVLAVPTHDTGVTNISGAILGTAKGELNLKNKECLKEVLKDILKFAARRLLAQMTQSTVNWINTGFHGAPLFLENPGSFFKDIAKFEIRDLVNTIGHDSVRQPFGKNAALGIINSFKSTFEQNSQYSLSKVTNDPALLDRFRSDFSTGGWDGFLLTTQFPQNNEIGYNLLVGEEQARRLSGTESSPANTIKDLLAQGQGFLSPQTCSTNPSYNNLKNEFQQPPSYKVIGTRPVNTCDEDFVGRYNTPEYRQCNAKYQAAVKAFDKTQADWISTKVCPPRPDGSSGLINTTPGSVVAGQIIKAVNGPFSQTELGAAMGNSLSAIFDALLNKLMSSGLNALSSKTGSSANNNNDNFSYDGQTLGSDPNTGTSTGFNWGGPDEIVVLGTFKKDVQNAIANGNKEIISIDGSANGKMTNDLAYTPGLLQLFDSIWPKTQELDMCIPGPNLGWQARLDADIQKTSSDDATYNNKKSAADSFKEWLTNKMKLELPGTTSYLSAVSSISIINEQADTMTARENVIRETLIKLQSIQAELNTLNIQPDPGTGGEATMVRLKQRYDGMILDISTSSSVNDVENKLADARDKLFSLGTSFDACSQERRIKGWANPGGENSVFNKSSKDTEKSVFCSSYGNSDINCDVVFKTDIADYKNSSTPTYPTR
ncbi:MAG TPA: hypothetical protein VGO63_02815 [Candidatus Paceibacterota bacterium]|jgi:hypothetical protein|nr:hypothetical protein [Candidatus Paceibacterota bacterium]